MCSVVNTVNHVTVESHDSFTQITCQGNRTLKFRRCTKFSIVPVDILGVHVQQF